MLMLYMGIDANHRDGPSRAAQRNVSPMTDAYREVHIRTAFPPPTLRVVSCPLRIVAPVPAQPASSLALTPNLEAALLERLDHPVRHDGQHRLTRDPVQRVGKGEREVDRQERGTLISV